MTLVFQGWRQPDGTVVWPNRLGTQSRYGQHEGDAVKALLGVSRLTPTYALTN